MDNPSSSSVSSEFIGEVLDCNFGDHSLTFSLWNQGIFERNHPTGERKGTRVHGDVFLCLIQEIQDFLSRSEEQPNYDQLCCDSSIGGGLFLLVVSLHANDNTSGPDLVKSLQAVLGADCVMGVLSEEDCWDPESPVVSSSIFDMDRNIRVVVSNGLFEPPRGRKVSEVMGLGLPFPRQNIMASGPHLSMVLDRWCDYLQSLPLSRRHAKMWVSGTRHLLMHRIKFWRKIKLKALSKLEKEERKRQWKEIMLEEERTKREMKMWRRKKREEEEEEEDGVAKKHHSKERLNEEADRRERSRFDDPGRRREKGRSDHQYELRQVEATIRLCLNTVIEEVVSIGKNPWETIYEENVGVDRKLLKEVAPDLKMLPVPDRIKSRQTLCEIYGTHNIRFKNSRPTAIDQGETSFPTPHVLQDVCLKVSETTRFSAIVVLVTETDEDEQRTAKTFCHVGKKLYEQFGRRHVYAVRSGCAVDRYDNVNAPIKVPKGSSPKVILTNGFVPVQGSCPVAGLVVLDLLSSRRSKCSLDTFLKGLTRYIDCLHEHARFESRGSFKTSVWVEDDDSAAVVKWVEDSENRRKCHFWPEEATRGFSVRRRSRSRRSRSRRRSGDHNREDKTSRRSSGHRDAEGKERKRHADFDEEEKDLTEVHQVTMDDIQILQYDPDKFSPSLDDGLELTGRNDTFFDNSAPPFASDGGENGQLSKTVLLRLVRDSRSILDEWGYLAVLVGQGQDPRSVALQLARRVGKDQVVAVVCRGGERMKTVAVMEAVGVPSNVSAVVSDGFVPIKDKRAQKVAVLGLAKAETSADCGPSEDASHGQATKTKNFLEKLHKFVDALHELSGLRIHRGRIPVRVWLSEEDTEKVQRCYRSGRVTGDLLKLTGAGALAELKRRKKHNQHEEADRHRRKSRSSRRSKDRESQNCEELDLDGFITLDSA